MNKTVILHKPHASSIVPNKYGYLIGEEELQQEIQLLTDWHTDELFYVDGGINISADFSRIFCDVERFSDDEQEVMSKSGMGFTYTKKDDGSELRYVSAELKSEILNCYYNPHHTRLTSAVERQLSLHDRALIIDCHSFSSKPFQRDLNQEIPRPDFCIGTDDFHTPRRLRVLAVLGLRMQGYTVKINDPYVGSIVPTHYYKKDKRVMSIMIEVNRDLYLIPGTNQKSENYCKVKESITTMLSFLTANDYDVKHISADKSRR